MQFSTLCLAGLILVCTVSCQLQTPNYRNMQGNVDLARMMMSAQPRPTFKVPAVPPARLPVYIPPVRQQPMYNPWNNFWNMYIMDDIFGTGLFE